MFLWQELKNKIINHGGEEILSFYNENKILNNVLRKKLVNIAVKILIDLHGFKPPTEAKINIAKSIIALCPNLKDTDGKGHVSLLWIYKFFYCNGLF